MRTTLAWQDITRDCKLLADKIDSCDVIVSAGRGGLVPSVIISHILNVPIYNFGIRSYTDDNVPGEIAFDQTLGIKFVTKYRDKRVIIIDDLSDKGKTIMELNSFFELQQFTHYKFATLYIKESTSYVPNFYIKRFDDNIWLDFPWESVKLDK